MVYIFKLLIIVIVYFDYEFIEWIRSNNIRNFNLSRSEIKNSSRKGLETIFWKSKIFISVTYIWKYCVRILKYETVENSSYSTINITMDLFYKVIQMSTKEESWIIDWYWIWCSSSLSRQEKSNCMLYQHLILISLFLHERWSVQQIDSEDLIKKKMLSSEIQREMSHKNRLRFTRQYF